MSENSTQPEGLLTSTIVTIAVNSYNAGREEALELFSEICKQVKTSRPEAVAFVDALEVVFASELAKSAVKPQEVEAKLRDTLASLMVAIRSYRSA